MIKLVEPDDGRSIDGIDVPRELYWVIASPTPLAGMKFPRDDFPWSNLEKAGFSQVVSIHPGEYDPSPLRLAFAEQLEDLVSGGSPTNEGEERAKVRRAVDTVVNAWRSGQGVVVHCWGGRGRTGTVLGCVLRELGLGADKVLDFLDRVHKARGKPGWPESTWQRDLVKDWKDNA